MATSLTISVNLKLQKLDTRNSFDGVAMMHLNEHCHATNVYLLTNRFYPVLQPYFILMFDDKMYH